MARGRACQLPCHRASHGGLLLRKVTVIWHDHRKPGLVKLKLNFRDGQAEPGLSRSQELQYPFRPGPTVTTLRSGPEVTRMPAMPVPACQWIINLKCTGRARRRRRTRTVSAMLNHGHLDHHYPGRLGVTQRPVGVMRCHESRCPAGTRGGSPGRTDPVTVGGRRG
jgi:hypothetical protein